LPEFKLPPPHPSVKERLPRGGLSYDQPCPILVNCHAGSSTAGNRYGTRVNNRNRSWSDPCVANVLLMCC
jgi:hypothetical protein